MWGAQYRWLGLVLWLGLCAGAEPPVASSDRLGPGDVLEVMVPRYPEFSRQYPVATDGSISLSLVGAVPVQGLTTTEVASLLTRRLSEYLRRPEGLSVRVIDRRMTVRVLGQVANPGLKEAPKGADIQELLALAGGAAAGAVLDQLELRRQQGDFVEIVGVDLKSWLEGGGELPALQDGDTLFVPRSESDETVQPVAAVPAPGGGPAPVATTSAAERVTVLGAVRAPGEYPLRDERGLLRVLNRAGGWTPDADLARIRRVPEGGGPAETIDLRGYLYHGGELPEVEPGDIITVAGLGETDRSVTVLGAVAQPGRVALRLPGDLQTALAAAGGVDPQGDLSQVRLTRALSPERPLIVDLEQYLESGNPDLVPGLEEGDTVFVPLGNRAPRPAGPTAFVFGSVARPGAFPLVADRSLLNLLAQAGGALPTADLRHLRLTRAKAAGGQPGETIDLEAYQAGNAGALPEVRDGDTLTVPANRVTVLGAVVKAGPLELPSQATVMDALAAAGGPRDDADLARVTLTHPAAGGLRETVDLEQYLYEPGTAPPLPRVQAGDVIAVEAGAVDERLVYVLGAVTRPGAVAIPGREASVLYALAEAGGTLPTADTAEVRILRQGATGLEAEQFDLRTLLSGEATTAAPRIRPGDVVSVLELSGVGRGVLVLGAVTAQGRVDVEAGQTVIDTLGKAGGALPNADPRRARLLRKDGTVIDLRLTDYTRTGEPSPLVADGDVLVLAFRQETRSVWDQLLGTLPLLGWFIR